MDMNVSKLQQTGDDRKTWRAAVHGVAKSRTQLSNWKQQKVLTTHSPCFCQILSLPLTWNICLPPATVREKAMATHSSALAWKIPWTEEPGRLQPMGFRRVGHDWVTSLSLFTLMHWRKKWQPTPVFFPGESQGWRSLVGCRLWGHTE